MINKQHTERKLNMTDLKVLKTGDFQPHLPAVNCPPIPSSLTEPLVQWHRSITTCHHCKNYCCKVHKHFLWFPGLFCWSIYNIMASNIQHRTIRGSPRIPQINRRKLSPLIEQSRMEFTLLHQKPVSTTQVLPIISVSSNWFIRYMPGSISKFSSTRTKNQTSKQVLTIIILFVSYD